MRPYVLLQNVALQLLSILLLAGTAAALKERSLAKAVGPPAIVAQSRISVASSPSIVVQPPSQSVQGPLGSAQLPVASQQPLVATAPRATCKQQRAVCITGAARSMLQQDVMQNFKAKISDHLGDCGSIFYHLFVGKELSAHGEEALPESQAPVLAAALMSARRYQLQFEENNFTCGQMTTGRFFKQAACARMVLDYEKETGTKYDAVFFVRPDATFGKPLPLLKQNPSKPAKWYVSFVEGDLVAISSEGLPEMAKVDEAKCCDLNTRSPPQCFLPGLKEPRSNFIFDRHLSSGLTKIRWQEVFESNIGNHVVRKDVLKGKSGDEVDREIMKGEMHGKYRQEVNVYAWPAVSGVISYKDKSGVDDNAKFIAEQMRKRLPKPEIPPVNGAAEEHAAAAAAGTVATHIAAGNGTLQGTPPSAIALAREPRLSPPELVVTPEHRTTEDHPGAARTTPTRFDAAKRASSKRASIWKLLMDRNREKHRPVHQGTHFTKLALQNLMRRVKQRGTRLEDPVTV
eukprot:TRINITY_DN16024_c0_g1_i1.p1 TRINITY_DN16024_c0_g1~~TRINITY_DN16024_c0_g1_i1.p1  ORF type:complete len:537 (+),score=105.27 TRINITY_DN16024_c0_g1_i1:66-1613(+)